MPSFDVVSEVDKHELKNAVDQANRETNTRFDFKGTDSIYSLNEFDIILESQSEFQLQQMMDILQNKMVKRGIDILCLEILPAELSGKRAKQTVKVKQGISVETARDMVKKIKAQKLKVQAAIQSEQVRVTGKSRDDLQAVIAMLKTSDFALPLQFTNFRD